VPLALFDLDNTLLDRDTAYAVWAKGFSPAWDLPESAVAYMVSADGDGLRPRSELSTAARGRVGLSATVDELVDTYQRDYPATFPFPDDSRNALRRLRSAGWTVGVVTNGPQFQERKLDVVQLWDEVDAVCISALVDSSKPDSRIFVEAARWCRTDLDGWMVGDSGPADIRGGQGVGLRTIWIHRGRTWVAGDPPPGAQSSGIPDAVRIILGDATPDLLSRSGPR
jgi:putative hydrolase of the HAD superfamily